MYLTVIFAIFKYYFSRCRKQKRESRDNDTVIWYVYTTIVVVKNNARKTSIVRRRWEIGSYVQISGELVITATK